MPETVAEQFEDMEKQAHAARLGMWAFLASEVLFFSGLFALYAAYRVEHPWGFGVGVEHNTIAWGSANTAVLFVSSYTVSLAVHQLRRGKHYESALLVGVTIFLGACFLGIKTGEYLKHFSDGIYPAGVGDFYRHHGDAGTKMFFTLYFCMTGLHSIHLFVGMCVLAVLLVKVVRRDIGGPRPSHPLALGAVYWHFVDMVWI